MGNKSRTRQASSGSRNPWSDHLTRKARADNYPARSVYKLMEIQQRFHILKPGNTVLDLGCAPGSWLLYAAGQVGQGGRVFGIDLTPVTVALPDGVIAIQGDIFEERNFDRFDPGANCHVVLSDMAPATTGRKDVDAARSVELCRKALETAVTCLIPGGHFVCKIFQGSEFTRFEQEVHSHFGECRIFKPESCRKQSKEIYIIAKGKR